MGVRFSNWHAGIHSADHGRKQKNKLQRFCSRSCKKKINDFNPPIPQFEIACWGDLFCYYVDFYNLEPSLVLELSLDELQHIALNRTVFQSWENQTNELAKKHAERR